MPTTIKEFIKIYVPLAIVAITLSTWLLHTRNATYVELVGERQATMVAQSTRFVNKEMHLLASDAQFMARLVARNYRPEGGPNIAELDDAFADFARSRDFYFILRFLDADGMERVRVDRTFAGPVVSPTQELQNKSSRYYFINSLRAGKNDVYLSNFDLNIEHGRIEIPYRPTLRFGCPVIDATGRKRGVVILNYNGSTLLDEIRKQNDTESAITMLCNGDGYWMLGPRPEDEWGQVLEGASMASMEQRFPDAWQMITAGDKGQFRTEDGLFSFNTISIIPDRIMSDVPPTKSDARKRWKVITWVPADSLRVPWATLYVSLNVLFLLLLAAGCWQFADNKTRQTAVRAMLRENEERILAISHSSRDAIMMVDDEGGIVHWNPAAERLFGYGSKEVMGLRLHDLLVPEQDREQAHKGVERFSRTGEGPIFDGLLELEALRKDGRHIPIELAVSPFRFKDKWYAVGSVRDIANRKKRQQDLKRSEETSRALINATPDSAMLIEPHGTIVAINDIGAQQFGYGASTMIGKNAFEHLSRGMQQDHRNIVLQVLQTGEPVRYEDRQGDRMQMINVYPVKGDDGAVVELAIFCRDVTEQRKAEAALMQSEQRFRDVSESIGEFIWETDADGRFSFLTDDVLQVLGYSASELIGKRPHKMTPEEDADDFRIWIDSTYTRRAPFSNIEVRYITREGRVIWLQVSGAPYEDEHGIFRGFRGAAMNITDRKETEETIKYNERKLRALAESAYDSIIMIDAKGCVSFWNHASVELFGYTEEEAIGNPVNMLIIPEEERTRSAFGLKDKVIAEKHTGFRTVQETIAMRKDGSRFPVERSIASFRLGNEWCAVATIRDITQRKATEAKLRELATTDSLTGLYNRRRFMELAEREFARSIRYDRQLSLFMIDIDLFKNVNDTYGHSVGDEVLRALSETAILALRNADIIGRLGGEEFAVLLPETGGESAQEVAERLRQSVERTIINTAVADLQITVSIGVATRNSSTNVVETLLKEADVALYDAKQSGRNRVVTS